MLLRGRGAAPGTCGEFAQGLLPDRSEFHVTCPIDRCSTVEVGLAKASRFEVNGLRDDQSKLQAALRRVCELLELGPVAITARQCSELDIGKGMGSSTADVLAGMRAVADAVGCELAPETQGELAAKIEASDGTMYPGIAAVAQRTGVALRRWQWYPSFAIAMLVPRERVLTGSVRFDGKETSAVRYAELLAGFDEAIARRSAATFARLSTEAVTLNAPYLINPYAQLLQGRLDDLGALGLNVGHTGTVCGILFPNTSAGREQAGVAATTVRSWFPELRDVMVVTTPPSPEERQ